MGHPSRSMEDSSAEGNLYYEVPAQEISEGKILPSGPETIFVIFWQKKKNVAVFCPCPENVLEAKLKNLD